MNTTASINITMDNDEVVVKFDVPHDSDPAIITLAKVIHAMLGDIFRGSNEKETP